MRSRIRTLAALTAGFLAAATAAATPAMADPPNDADYRGGCVLFAVSDRSQVLTGRNDFLGVLGGEVIGLSPTLGHNPVSVSFTCSLYVNGALIDTADGSGAVAATGAKIVGFSAGPTANVVVCESVTTTDNHAQVKTFPTECDTAPRDSVPSYDVQKTIIDGCLVTFDEFTCNLIANTAYETYVDRLL